MDHPPPGHQANSLEEWGEIARRAPRAKQAGVAVKEPAYSLSPSSCWETQDAAVSAEIDLPDWDNDGKCSGTWRQIKRQNVEETLNS